MFEKISVGDRVRIEDKFEDVFEFEVVRVDATVLESRRSLWYEREIKSLKVLEHRVPTANGIYRDEDGDLWTLYEGDAWSEEGGSVIGGLEPEYAPYTLVATIKDVEA